MAKKSKEVATSTGQLANVGVGKPAPVSDKIWCHRCDKDVTPIEKMGGWICPKCRTIIKAR